MQETGTAVAMTARIFGGEWDKPNFGIWLYHDPSAFGVVVGAVTGDQRGVSAVRTGTSRGDVRWADSLSADRFTAIKQLRGHLETETDLVERHFIFNLLEEHLYACREVFASALMEFETTCERHHAEMTSIRPALLAKFEGLPMLPTYRQMVIMKGKAHLYAEALAWVERGLTVYGDDCIRSDAVADLRTRIGKLRKKIA
jgi:hypothetical protein